MTKHQNARWETGIHRRSRKSLFGKSSNKPFKGQEVGTLHCCSLTGWNAWSLEKLWTVYCCWSTCFVGKQFQSINILPTGRSPQPVTPAAAHQEGPPRPPAARWKTKQAEDALSNANSKSKRQKLKALRNKTHNKTKKCLQYTTLKHTIILNYHGQMWGWMMLQKEIPLWSHNINTHKSHGICLAEGPKSEKSKK